MALYLPAFESLPTWKTRKKINQKSIGECGIEPVIIGLAIQKISVIFIDCFYKFY